MYFQDPQGGLHFLDASDIERGRTFASVPKLDNDGQPELRHAHDGISGELLFEVDGTTAVMEPVYVIEEGANTALAMLPQGSVPITDDQAYAIQHPPETLQQAAQRLQWFVQAHMDEAARAVGYDDIKTAVTYADEPAVPLFKAQGKAFRAWRSLVWAACYAKLAEAETSGVIPTEAEVLASLPALELPS